MGQDTIWLNQLLKIVRKLKQEGRHTIQTGDLEQVLEDFIKAAEDDPTKATAPLLESTLTQFRQQTEHERNLAYYEATNRWNLNRMTTTAQLEQTAIKSSIMCMPLYRGRGA